MVGVYIRWIIMSALSAMHLLPFLSLLLLLTNAKEDLEFESETEEMMQDVLSNEDIRNTWQEWVLEQCFDSPDAPNSAPPLPNHYCYRQRLLHSYDLLDVEILSRRPAILKLSNFLPHHQLSLIEDLLAEDGDQLSSIGVEGPEQSKGHQGRRADGLWLPHNLTSMVPLFERLQHALTLNPAMGEDFLLLKYLRFGHYAFHYDHLEPMIRDYDEGWYEYFGNRLATALLLVQTASLGGYTIFPNLHLTIRPERGDLILWLNADSNDSRELNSLHAACPIQQGEKVAVSLWIRGKFQDSLQCSIHHEGYEPEQLLRSSGSGLRFKERPPIPDIID